MQPNSVPKSSYVRSASAHGLPCESHVVEQVCSNLMEADVIL
jgi:hypothetical protein